MELEKLTILIESIIINFFQDIYFGEIYCDEIYCGEKNKENNDKVLLKKYSDLISHKFDYEHKKYKKKIYKKRSNLIKKLKKIPQAEQKSIEWLTQRMSCLTATAISAVLDEDPYKYPIEILLDKCGKGQPFIENENVHHGKKYEEIGNMFYSFRNNINVSEYGLLIHEVHKFIGASPDGICDKYCKSNNNLSKLVGRLLEIKFPKKRMILTKGRLDGDICPHYYYIQVQVQLFVTGLKECDFLQCQIEEYDSFEEYLADTHTTIFGLSKKTGLEKGCLIQLLPKDKINGDPKMCLYNAKYIYPPKLHMTNNEIKEWIANEILNFSQNDLYQNYVIDKIIYWRLTKVACNLIKYEKEWFESKIPLVGQFWKYIEFYRKYPKKLDNLVKTLKKIDKSKSDEIFKIVHDHYSSKYPNTKYKPLYQNKNKWRIEYDNKKIKYQKYQKYQKNKSKNQKNN